MKLSTNKLVQLVAWFSILLVALNKFHIASFLDNEIISVITAIIIIGQIQGKWLISLENLILSFL
jgi:hypothetical protein